MTSRFLPDFADGYVPSLDFARVYSALGDRDRAIDWLGEGIEERNFAISFLMVDPMI